MPYCRRLKSKSRQCLVAFESRSRWSCGYVAIIADPMPPARTVQLPPECPRDLRTIRSKTDQKKSYPGNTRRRILGRSAIEKRLHDGGRASSPVERRHRRPTYLAFLPEWAFCWPWQSSSAEAPRFRLICARGGKVEEGQSSTWLTMPSASFGSNQVDFGGMIAPASATAMRSRICVG
jgi:hypothetical protein